MRKTRGEDGGTAVAERPVVDETPAGTEAIARTDGVGFEVKALRLDQIAESPHNPRKHFDQARLEELAESLRQSGQQEPVIVRPHPSGALHGVYELAAGHRRFRAAKLAGLEALAAIVRPMDDAAFLELLTLSNLQREDVHPLEEADGYAEMQLHLHWDVPTIAKRVGKSESYIYDRLTLRTLIPEIRELFFAGTITPSHAIELARLGATDQQRALEDGDEEGALFEPLYTDPLTRQEKLALDDRDGADEPPARPRKVRTVRELKAWINREVRFVETDAQAPQLFPESVPAILAAQRSALPVVGITLDGWLATPPDFKGPESERIYGPRDWKEASGESSECEHAVLGVVRLGPGRGDAFPVCAARETCTLHWAEEIEEARKGKRQRASDRSRTNGAGKSAAVEDSWAKREKAVKARAAAHYAARAPIAAAFEAAISKDPDSRKSKVAALLLRGHLHHGDFQGAGSDWQTAADLLRVLAGKAVTRTLTTIGKYHWDLPRLKDLAKHFGVDLKALVKAHEASQAKSATPSKQSKAPAKLKSASKVTVRGASKAAAKPKAKGKAKAKGGRA